MTAGAPSLPGMTERPLLEDILSQRWERGLHSGSTQLCNSDSSNILVENSLLGSWVPPRAEDLSPCRRETLLPPSTPSESLSEDQEPDRS